MREQIACLPEKLPRDESKIGYTERAKKFPKYAYGANGNSSLVHKVKAVWLRWYELADGGWSMQRRINPGLLAETVCGYSILLTPNHGRTCEIPKPDAVLCGRCHGQGANFPRGKEHAVPMSLAKVRLGCIAQGMSR